MLSYKDSSLMAKKKNTKRIFKKSLFGFFFVVSLFLGAFAIYNFFFFGLIYPKTYIAGVAVSGRKVDEATRILDQNVKPPNEIILTTEKEKFKISLSELGFGYDFSASAQSAFNLVRTGNFFYDAEKRLLSLFKESHLGLRVNIDKEKLKEALFVVGSQISTPAIYPRARFINGGVQVERGAPGTELDEERLILRIYENLSLGKNEEIILPIKTVDPSLSEAEVELLQLRAEKLLSKSLTFRFEFEEFTFSKEKLISLLDAKTSGYDQKKIEEVKAEIAGQVNRPPQDPVFVFEGGRVEEFLASKDGVTLKEDTFNEMLLGNLTTLEIAEVNQIVVELPVEKIPPKIKTEEVNNLGIKELIGRGSSRFAHSIPNRIHNVGLASSRFRGVLIAPGEIFSFNEVLGDVSSYTGYKQAFVIKDGRTVLGDGGGVCQVSTTFFRAALNAGLPIIERRAHSYRVGYYEQDSPPGIDATVFAPSTDLKVKNDTPGHLLIQTIFDAKAQSLVFEIYGTNDGRVASISKPAVSGVTPPPPDLYVDDPTLSAGTIKQVDFKASGAKASFNYRVTRGGNEIFAKTFVSNYRPWQAVFLRGTGPAQ